MGSLRARHSKKCALAVGRKHGRETAAPKDEREKIPNCTCTPVYSIRGGAGQGYDRIGKNLRTALRALSKAQVDEDAGVHRAIENLTFEKWSDRWINQLTRPSANTIDEYRATMVYAKDAFGSKQVRRLTPGDIAGMLATMRERKVSPSTQAKHLRVLGACLRSAISHGYAGSNPLERLPRTEKPHPERRESGYFVDGEIPRLLAEIPEGL